MMTPYNPFSLEGKTVLVTGASSGIGRATAIEVAKLGATVVLTGRNRERLQETLSRMAGSGHMLVPCDLGNPDDRKCLADCVPKLDGIAHIAGVGIISLMAYASEEKFKHVYESNVFFPFLLQQCLLKAKKVKRGASIVFMASASAYASVPGIGIYGGSKAALLRSSKFLAKELAPKRIRVNSISPAIVTTPMTEGSMFTHEEQEADIQRYPLKRYGNPEEIAWAVVYLLSDAAQWTTGIDLVVDGGFSL